MHLVYVFIFFVSFLWFTSISNYYKRPINGMSEKSKDAITERTVIVVNQPSLQKTNWDNFYSGIFLIFIPMCKVDIYRKLCHLIRRPFLIQGIF